MTRAHRPATMWLVERGYAVTWHEANRRPYSGRLELGPTYVAFEGAEPCGRQLVQKVLLRDLAAVRIGRVAAERVAGRPALVLERRGGPPVHVLTVGDPGSLYELADRLRPLPEPEAE